MKALLLAFALTLLTPAAHAQTPGHDCTASVAPPDTAEQTVIDTNNVYRAAHGLAPLIYDPDLERTARWKATENASIGSDEHNDPFRTWEQRFVDCGFALNGQWLGENLAAGQRYPDEVEGDWQASPHHNENLLRPEFHRIGVAVAAGGGPFYVYWAMELAE